MERSTRGTARVLAVLCAAVLAFAMFGFADAGAAAKHKKTTVKVAKVPGVGAVLVDTSGKTLYTLTDADGTAVECTGACLQAWPAAMVSANAKVKAPKRVKSLSTTDANQVTWKDLPLYTFAGDSGPKVANGEGIVSFGGTWHVVKVGNRAATTATTTPTSKSPSGKSSSGGYSGY
jgi:predicted lipoprotein with Yx(FWY)xxD motif